jgi:hypothetical protein
VWDRLVSPPGETPTPQAFENAIAFRGPTWFSRTTNGGASWEPARLIYQPGTLNQTIGNQIVVLPDNAQFDGELVNVFDLIQGAANRPPGRGFSIAVIRSTDNGATWSRRAIIVDRHSTFQGLVIDPDDPNPATQPVRTGDIIPQVTVDPNSGAIYIVFQDARFGPRSSIAFTQSLDGGLTWSRTIKINKTPTDISLGNQQAFTRSLACSTTAPSVSGTRTSEPTKPSRRSSRWPPPSSSSIVTCPPHRLHELGELGRGGADHRRLVQHAPGALRPRLVRRGLRRHGHQRRGLAAVLVAAVRNGSRKRLRPPRRPRAVIGPSSTNQLERPGQPPGTLRLRAPSSRHGSSARGPWRERPDSEREAAAVAPFSLF